MTIIERTHSASLRTRLEQAGCVFQFVVMQVAPEITVDETVHRQALRALHQQLMVEALDWHRQLIRNPQYADHPEPVISWNADKAIAREISAAELLAADAWLYRAFREPPYRTRFEGGEQEAQALFHDWTELLGLVEAEQPQAIDWVSNLSMDHERGEEPWSDYFDAGLEWWGVYCLTIWNPQRRTLGALIASATD